LIRILLLAILSFDLPYLYNVDMQGAPYSIYSNPLKSSALLAIRLYQATISKVQGDVCNFVPSCSHYGYDAIKKKGLILGILATSDRLQRCHPFAFYYGAPYYSIVVDSLRGAKVFDPVK